MHKVNVFILAFREADRIGACLDAIEKQNGIELINEVVVIDYPSGDGTSKEVEKYKGKLKIRYLPAPVAGRAQGLNFAIQQAPCDYFIRVDSRSKVPSDYFSRLISTIVKTKADVVGGVQRATIAADMRPKEKAIAVAMNSIFGSGPSRHRTGRKSGPADVVYLGIYNTDSVKQIDGFDEASHVVSEEVDYFFRIRKAGGVVFLLSDLIVNYRTRGSLIEQFRLYFRYGGAKSQFIKKYGSVINLRQLAPVGLFSFLFISASLAPLSYYFSLMSIALGATYAIFLFAAAAFESYKHDSLNMMPALVVTLALMHFGYFLGYVTNLLSLSRSHWSG